MTNLLTGSVRVVNLPPVVWYNPEGFPTVQTDAELVDGDGDLLLVSNGWQLKLISVQQVCRIVPARSAETIELMDMEREEYDAETI